MKKWICPSLYSKKGLIIYALIASLILISIAVLSNEKIDRRQKIEAHGLELNPYELFTYETMGYKATEIDLDTDETVWLTIPDAMAEKLKDQGSIVLIILIGILIFKFKLKCPKKGE